MAFFGEFDHKIDPKGRINLPAQYRDDFTEGGYLTYLPPRTAIFTKDGWGEYQEQIAETKKFTRAELELLTAFTTEFKPDAQNRIVISAKTRERCGLGELVTVVGAQKYLSIWDREEWQQHQARLLSVPEVGKSLAQKFAELDFI